MSIQCDNLATAVWIYDIDNFCIHWANTAALKLWEATSLAELCARDFKPGTSDAVQKTLLGYQESFKKQQVLSMYWHFTPKDIPKQAFCLFSGYSFKDGRIGLSCEAISATLITDSMPRNTSMMLSTYDTNGNFISANPPFVEMMGAEISHLKQVLPAGCDFENVINTLIREQQLNVDKLLTTDNGELWFNLQISLSDAKLGDREILIQQLNINERKLEQIYLTQQAYTDPLTGLLNRRGLTQQLEKRIDDETEFFIYYIDLDSFKMTNDSMGHAVGDLVLRALAKRLKSKTFNKAIACRFGGDEFILIVNKDNTNQTQMSIADKLLKLTNQPYIDSVGNPILVSASVGSAHFPKDGTDLNKLLLRADAAMYVAKSQGKKRGIRYTNGMEDSLQRSSLVARHLYLAIEHSEFELHYQPVIDTSNQQIHSFEAILHWNNAALGFVPTQEVMQVAESIGIIAEIGNWVINQALSDLTPLRQATYSQALININIHDLHFKEIQLHDYLQQILKKYHLQANDLLLAMPETTLLQDLKQQCFAASLAKKGFNLAIAEFGTGISSLAFLPQMAINTIKIDRCFTANFEQNPTILMSLQQLLKSLDLTIVIEGVLNEQQSEQLHLIGINLQQGFILAEPKPLSFYIEQASTDRQADG
ncbi:MAG: EAL domain-containing protein [Oceanospirillaceae bacterium]